MSILRPYQLSQPRMPTLSTAANTGAVNDWSYCGYVGGRGSLSFFFSLLRFVSTGPAWEWLRHAVLHSGEVNEFVCASSNEKKLNRAMILAAITGSRKLLRRNVRLLVRRTALPTAGTFSKWRKHIETTLNLFF